MQIGTACEDGARQALREWRPDAVVSLASPRRLPEPIAGVEHLRIGCHDIEAVREGARIGPAAADVRRVIEMARRRPGRVLVHCTAGLSRSTAFALVMAVAGGWSPAAACAALRHAVPHAGPNRLAVALGDELLGLDCTLMLAVHEAFAVDRDARGARGERTGFALPFVDPPPHAPGA